MKKFVLLFGILTLTTISLCISQTATSITSGSWLNPMTWGGTIPTPGYTILINTDVVMDVDFGYSTGSITINSGASLTESTAEMTLSINGGSFTNNGTLDVSNLACYAGSVQNNYEMNINRIFYNATFFTNTGMIYEIDSMLNNGTIQNEVNAEINAHSFLNNGTSTNEGTNNHTLFTNSGLFMNSGRVYFLDFTNAGYFQNDHECVGSHDFTNAMSFVNSINATFSVVNDFLNYGTSGNANFYNDGSVEVGNNWLNTDSITGTSGNFSVQNLTGNDGIMHGSFDFCDQTPPSVSPYIDNNTGVVDASITYCTTTSIETSIDHNLLVSFLDGQLTIETQENSLNLDIYNIQGQLIQKIVVEAHSNYQTELSNGMYLYTVHHNDQHQENGKFLIQ